MEAAHERVAIRPAQPSNANAIAGLIAVLTSDLGEPSTVTADCVVEVLRKGTCHLSLAELSGQVLVMVTFS